VESDLLGALGCGQLAAAVLDVFELVGACFGKGRRLTGLQAGVGLCLGGATL
jgi:hypothetical protein